MSTRNVNLEKWRGRRDAVELDPASMEFEAQRGAKCGRCAFNGQWSRVCTIAQKEALKRGLPHCDDGTGFVYVLVERDPRQFGIEGA